MTPARTHRRVSRLRAFTLIELLITISIIGMMASMILFAAYSAQETAKVAKTKALIAKLDAIIKSRWDGYKTRRVPVTIPAGTVPPAAAVIRLTALRDLMRMEMPDRWSDVSDSPATLPFIGGSINRPALSQGYLRKFSARTPSGTFAGAECLYLIVMSAVAEEGDAREVFKPDDMADTDGDGYFEFVDAWKQPIKFLRWAPGFQLSELQIVAHATASGGAGPNQVMLSGNPSTDPAAFTGGAIMQIDNASNSKLLDVVNSNLARIVSYTPANGLNQASIAYSVPSGSPTFSGPVAIAAPDPFDVFAACVASTGASAAPFALYPLIYSSGPDKCYGLLADFSAVAPLRYAAATSCTLDPVRFGGGATASINPFTIQIDNATSQLSMLGAARNDPAEPNYVPSAWLDNIHNHMQGTR